MRSFPSVGGLILAISFVANLGTVTGRAPVQTYFIPLPEADLLRDGFRKISTTARGNVNSFTSIAIAASGTVIWYDHWEDGYDPQIKAPGQKTTEIWGDGNCDNGFAPNINGIPRTCKSPSDDFLEAGYAITLDNDVNLPRDRKEFFFDGSDKLRASFPIAMTRGAFPRTPGSFLAGAVEVLDTESWGYHYVTPIGRNTLSETDAFEWSALFVMACEDGTEVSLPDGSTEMLREGENLSVLRVNAGDSVSSNLPLQVVLLAGDRQSVFELRWYSLSPITKWSNDYYTPVGTSKASTGAWLYNPGPDTIDVTYSFKGGISGTISNIQAKDAVLSPAIPDGSGARFTSSHTFYGITQTEIGPSGDSYDWGHPLIPTNLLTSQALVGWGYGCTDNKCVREGVEYSVSRSVVFVTPVASAVIKVDFDNDGVVDEVFTDVEAMQSVKLVSPDEDMTGALIFATTTEESDDSVKIAVSWGQDPARSGLGDSGALDLGTSVPPLPLLEAGKSTVLIDDRDGNDAVSPGDVLQYTIRVANIGQVNIPAGAWNVIDYTLPLSDSAVYKEGSATYSVYDRDDKLLKQEVIPDDSVGSAFPLDDEGISSIGSIEARGGSHEIQFEAIIRSVEELPPGSFRVNNKGVITQSTSAEPIDRFEDSTGYLIFPTETLEVCGDGDGCGPLISASGPSGTYCAEQKGENLEVEVTVTEPGCELWETHLCNLPYLSDDQLNTASHTLVIPSDEAYAFACGFDEENFVVAGHATLSCDDGTGERDVRKNTYFEIELCCDEIYPSGFEPPAGHIGPWGGPGTGSGGGGETNSPVVVPTSAPIEACDYTCPRGAAPKNRDECPESFADCECRHGFKLNASGDGCISDCGAFVCPPRSTPKRNCVRTIHDCVCDPGYAPVNDQCLVPS